MVALPRPVVRSFILCEDVRHDPHDRNQISLMRLVNTIRATSEPPYPAVRPSLCAFVQLTECRGSGELSLVIRADADDTVLFATPRRVVVFPDDPLAVQGLTFRIKNLVFPAPGLYWVQLLLGDHVLTHAPLTLK